MVVNELLYTCGVSSHTYNLLSALVKKPNIELNLLCGGGVAMEKFRKLDIPIIINEDYRHDSRSITGYLRAVKFLYQFVKKNEFDIIHAHHHYAASIAHKVGLLTKTKTILTNHGLLPEIGFLNHFSADHIIVVNEHILRYLVEVKRRNPHTIKLIRHGIPTKNIDKKFPKEKFKILAASRLVPEKGIDTYIHAIKLIPDKFLKKAEFYIAGEGEEENNLKSLKEELNTNVLFLGRVVDLGDKLDEFDIFVMPSFSSSEGFPMTVIEAAMNKCFIILANFEGVDYVFENEKDGFIFEIGNYHELAKKIEKAITDFEYLKSYTENFSQKVKNIFKIETMVEDTIQLYQDILIEQ